MLGDIIQIRPEYSQTADHLLQGIFQSNSFVDGQLAFPQNRLSIVIGGESGSGKSVTAVCLAQQLAAQNLPALILHLDDYFHLPPATNHQKRLEDLAWVGAQEVNLALLQSHIDAFHRGETHILKPLVSYHENEIRTEYAHFQPVLIVEGTYTFLLEHAHYYIFMERDYRDTIEQRKARGRDILDDFSEKVLAKEHEIVSPLCRFADAIVRKDYSVSFV